MYGLPQARILANKLLKKRLARQGYFEMPHTSGLWRHCSRPITFTLVADNFGIKYQGQEHAENLLKALCDDYTVEVDLTGKLYVGINLDWNYKKGYVDISMPECIQKQLTCYTHPSPRQKRHTHFDLAPSFSAAQPRSSPPRTRAPP